MSLRVGLRGQPTVLRPGDMLVYIRAERRIKIWRGKKLLYFAGGTFESFLIPQKDDGFGLASVVSYVTGLPFETREHLGVRAYLFGEPNQAQRPTRSTPPLRAIAPARALIEHKA